MVKQPHELPSGASKPITWARARNGKAKRGVWRTESTTTTINWAQSTDGRAIWVRWRWWNERRAKDFVGNVFWANWKQSDSGWVDKTCYANVDNFNAVRRHGNEWRVARNGTYNLWLWGLWGRLRRDEGQGQNVKALDVIAIGLIDFSYLQILN